MVQRVRSGVFSILEMSHENLGKVKRKGFVILSQFRLNDVEVFFFFLFMLIGAYSGGGKVDKVALYMKRIIDFGRREG